MARVSIVIPAYNAAAYLPAALASALAQTHDDCEIIVVDDGSDDDTPAVLAPFGDRIRTVRRDESGGASSARNEGIRAATGEYVAFLDSDDVHLPDKIRHAAGFLDDQPSVGMVFTDFILADESGRWRGIRLQPGGETFRALDKREVGKGRFLVRGDVAFDGLLLENFVGTSSVVCRKDLLLELGGFDESLSVVEDRDLWLRIASRCDLGYLDRVDHVYTVRTGGISKRRADVARARIEVFGRHIGSAHSPEARRETKRQLARSYFGLAYAFAQDGDLAAARRNYRNSLREAILVESLLGLVKASLGQRALGLLRRATGRPQAEGDRVDLMSRTKAGSAKP